MNTKEKLKALSDGKLHLGWLNDAEVVENFIKKLWHDGSQKPNVDKKIFVVDIYDDYYVGYPGGINPKRIKKWMYVNEMLLTLCYDENV